jgi:hypothetical protein
MSVIKSIEFPERSFATKAELFHALKKDKATLIDSKKSQIKNSDSIKASEIKLVDTIKGVHVEEGFIHAVINTTKYMDSHNDVHLDGIWNQSVKQQQGKIYFLVDHDLSPKSVVAYPKHVEMMLQDVAWKDLGANFEGDTQALIFKVAKENIELKEAKHIIDEKIAIEHSVRMQYVDVKLAMNSDEAEMKEEKANFDSYIDLVANKEMATESGYFWLVSEAKIFKEGSMVLAGSNDVTPMLLSDEKIEPLKNTQKGEPSSDTPKTDSTSKDEGGYINHIFI